jgi:Domain of unknown function (DUF4262)
MSGASGESLNEYERRVIDNIDKHGWFCTSVFKNKGKASSFSYSVGFTKTLNSPEFIVFGLDINLMHKMLWEVFHQIKDGRVPSDHQRWSNVLEGNDCVSRCVHPTNVITEYLNSAMWFWGEPAIRGGPLTAFQLVWPDVETCLYPWDSECPQFVRDRQPPLYQPNRALS